MKDMLTAADIHYDFVDVAGQLRVNTQILDAQGGHTEVNEPGSKLDDADFLRLIEQYEPKAVGGSLPDAGFIPEKQGDCEKQSLQ